MRNIENDENEDDEDEDEDDDDDDNNDDEMVGQACKLFTFHFEYHIIIYFHLTS